ncbi:MAG: hypothetical protein ACRDP6_22010 [Actinoallomurus sp.]
MDQSQLSGPRRRVARRAAGIVALASAAGALTLGGGTPANASTAKPATPQQCTKGFLTNDYHVNVGGWASCLSGTGTFAVHVLCSYVSGGTAYATGPFLHPSWVIPVSAAYCPSGSTASGLDLLI